jgi:uncharacterized membrane protein
MTNASSAASPKADGFDRQGALKALGLSLTINALCPYVIYRVLQSHFPANSIMPLLYATIFPVIGLILGIVRKRAADVIAIIAMAALGMHIAVTLVTATSAPRSSRFRSTARSLGSFWSLRR